MIAFVEILNNKRQLMTNLNNYLAKHYLNEAQLASAASISIDELHALIRKRLVPAPSYVIGDRGMVASFVFGEMEAPGSTPGSYFHPSQLVWIARARHVVASGPAIDAEARLKERFSANFAAALATLNLTTWRLPDSFDENGAPIADSLLTRTDSAWKYFLNGTFGLCVANPISEAHIACKEVLQEKLSQQSENGSKTMFSPQQARAMHELIDAYAASAMFFSPVEYALSSRKRLVEDLRANMRVSDAEIPSANAFTMQLPIR
ncbi:MAG TPA: hypothetical protein DCW29_13020 [Janthinobacterium sp.]|nr:hypothetical protein [Janthinobacterium sp.]